MIDEMKARIEAWAFRGPLWAQMLKTAVSHAIVWGGATILGGLAGLLVHALAGVYGVWSFGAATLGYAVGARFYLDREGGDVRDFLASEDHGSLAKLGIKLADGGLDLIMPWLVSTAILYGAAHLFGVL